MMDRQFGVRGLFLAAAVIAGLGTAGLSTSAENHGRVVQEEGEESGVYIGRNEPWDAVRRGAHLILSFDETAGAFVGTVRNTTKEPLCAVRVEVHLHEGSELGPTEKRDLRPGETMNVELSAEGESFESWTTHPEVSRCSEGGAAT